MRHLTITSQCHLETQPSVNPYAVEGLCTPVVQRPTASGRYASAHPCEAEHARSKLPNADPLSASQVGEKVISLESIEAGIPSERNGVVSY